MSSPSEGRIFVGVLRVGLRVPGARTLKDRRQVVSSLRDRIRHLYNVSYHEIGTGEDPQHQTFVVTTSGNDAKEIRSVLDRCASMVREHPIAQAEEVIVDVFRWTAPEQSWEAQMMAELSGSPESDG